MPSNSEPRIQVPCPTCGGQGRSVVTLEMAIDAGDRSMAGTEWGCSHCNGGGWILQEAAPGEISDVSYRAARGEQNELDRRGR